MDASTHEYEKLLTEAAFLADPYPGLARIQEESPVFWSDAIGGWVLSRYNDILVTFKDTQTFSNEGRLGKATAYLPPERRALLGAFEEHFSHKSLLHSDPPDHTRIRSIVVRELNSNVVQAIRPQIQAAVNELIDAFIGNGEFDVSSELASPLPIRIIAQILGVPKEDTHLFRTWADDMLAFQGVNKPSENDLERAQNVVIQMRPYIRQMMEDRRKEPRSDLVSMLTAAEAEGGRIAVEELISTCVTLIIAGQETTLSLIANAIWCLLSNPMQLVRLCDSPPLLAPAIEEVLRYESPVSRQPRLVKNDFELHGHCLKKGQMVFQLLNAANRDPEIFAYPHKFDISRQPNRHVAFGYGVHFCVGAILARAEAFIAIGTVLRRLRDLELIDKTPDWDIEKRNSRVLKSLRVRFEAGKGS